MHYPHLKKTIFRHDAQNHLHHLWGLICIVFVVKIPKYTIIVITCNNIKPINTKTRLIQTKKPFCLHIYFIDIVKHNIIVMEISKYITYILNIFFIFVIIGLIFGLIDVHNHYNKLYFKTCYKNNTSICDSKIFC